MLKELTKQYAPASVIGALIGMALVVWVEPRTTGGGALLMAVSVLICVAFSMCVRLLRRVTKKE